MTIIERTVYTVLDFLGDVGGLMGIIFSIAAFLHGFIEGNDLFHAIITKSVNQLDPDRDKPTSYDDMLKEIS